MAVTIYLIRHAQAEGNWKRLFQGHTDAAVSELGETQIEHLSQRMRDLTFDAVYASPLARAVQTAQGVAKGVPITIEPGIMEINGGDFEGVPFGDLPTRFPDVFAQWQDEPELCSLPAGESMQIVFDRMKAAIDKIAHAHPNQTVAIVSHGCAIRCFLCYAKGWDIKNLRYVQWCDNTGISKVEYDEQWTPHLIFENDSTHLPQKHSTFATQEWWKQVPQMPEQETTKGDTL